MWALQIIGLAIAYAITGKLGTFLAIPPGYATAIWPPSGIALAAILIYGCRIWPGIFIGAFLVNFSNAVVTGSLAEIFASVAITLAMCCGASLQAVAGDYLVRRYAGFPNSLTHEKEVLLFFLFGGILSTLVNSTIAVSALVAAARIPTTNFMTSWGTWWLGDALGVFIFTPLVLIWAQRSCETWRNRRMAISLPITAMFMLTTVGVFYASQNDSDQLKLDFSRRTTELKVALEKSILAHVNSLHSLESFYAATTTVEREEFRTFVAQPLANLPAIQALEWSPVVLSSERDAFEQSLKQQGYPNVEITERDADSNRIARAGNRPEYVPISYLEPYRGNERALGYDLYSDDLRREAINRARDTGEIAVTAPITLIQKDFDQNGILAFMPIYRNNLPHPSLEKRRSHILGYVLGVFALDNMVTVALEELDRKNLAYRLIDQTASASGQVIFSSNQKGVNPITLQEKGLFGRNLSLESRAIIHVGGRTWRFEVFPTLDYFSHHHSDSIWLILLAGLILSSMISVFVLVSSGRGSLLLRLVDERTAALVESEAKLRRLYELSPLGIALTDMSGRFIEFNEAFRRICGYASDELKTIDYWKLTPKKYESMEQQQLQSLQQTGRYGPYEKEYQRKNGTLIPLRLNGVLVKETDNNDYIWSIIEDISASKKAEDALRDAKLAADNASRAKSEFLANMSHEIRTPMNAIIGLSHLALNKEVSPEIRDYLEKISSSSNSLLSILNDILDFSKLEAGRLTIDHSPFELDEILDNIRNLFTDRATEKRLDFTLAVASDVPRGLIGDSLRLQQVLINLLGNAIKFTELGQVALNITAQAIGPEQARLLFCVTDTGIGISADDREKLFKPFSQVDGSITRRFGGSGLGLAISHNLLQLMGSEFSVESAPGQGSRFSFELVLDVLSLPSQHKIERKLGDHNPVQSDSAGLLAGTRVLVAEDNLINQQVIREFLNLAGIAVEIANNGKEAMALVDNGAFDAVLMDMHMPEMDGFEATKLIRSQARFAKLPVIALTAGVTKEERELCMALGMNDFIAKPIDPKKLLCALMQGIKPLSASAPDIPADEPAVENRLFPLDLPGFELQNLLATIGNNQELAIRLLLTFMESMKNVPDDIEALLAAKDASSAKKLVHKIKGSSGTIGAVRLHAASEALEAELNNQLALSAATFDNFREAFGQTMSVIAALRQSEELVSPNGGYPGALKPMAAELDLLLKANDFISDALLTRFKAGLASDQPDLFALLRKQINNLDYEEARKILRRIAAGLPDIQNIQDK
jgi:PAS domain S-box-containing protein